MSDKKPEKEYTKTPPTLSLEYINYNERHRMERGSLSQLIVHIGKMANNTRLSKPSNEFQKVIFPIVVDVCDRLYRKYLKMIDQVEKSENNVKIFSYFINGPRHNGSLRKPTGNRMEQNTYDYCELGQTLRAIKDRTFNISRECERRVNLDKSTLYKDDKVVYCELKKFSDSLKENVDDLVTEWRESVTKFKLNESKGP